MQAKEETQKVEAPTGDQTQHLIHVACQLMELYTNQPVMGFCGAVYKQTPGHHLKCPVCMEVADPNVYVTCPNCGEQVHFAGSL